MQHRPLAAIGITLFTCGLTTGLIGLSIGDRDLTVSGVLASVPAATAIVVAVLRQQHTATENALADAHRAGYALALNHVARGLFAPPATPRPGPGTPHRAEDNVIRLYLPAGEPPERKAL